MTLSKVVEVTVDRLNQICQSTSPIGSELEARFSEALRGIVTFEIAPLSQSFGAFTVTDEGKLTLNEDDVARLLDFVVSDLQLELSSGKPGISAEDVPDVLHDALCLFTLHEIRHRSQGVGDYKMVQKLKRVEGPEHITKFDVEADRDAALALAACRTSCAGPSEFFEYYQKALYFSVKYFFRLYPANSNRMDKTCRIAALLLMLARLELYMRSGALLDLEAAECIFVKISDDRTKMAVFSRGKTEKLVGISDNGAEVLTFSEQIQAGKLDHALSTAFRLIAGMKLG